MRIEPQADTEAQQGRPRTEPIVRRSFWPGWVWAVPIAAVGILAWLGLRFFVTHGAEVTLYFDSTPGVTPQSTRVTYRGVDVGQVTSVSLTPDGQRVRVQLSLDRSVDKYLRSGTRFWMGGLSSGLMDLPSLMSAISGPTIMMLPGPGTPQHVFTALSQAPAFSLPTAGSTFRLVADQHSSVKTGASVYYLGLAVGKVTAVRFVPPHRFVIDVLVKTPYDQLVHADSRFWDAGALQISMVGGLRVQLLSPMALLQGAIAFTTPQSAAAEPPSQSGAQFTLYKDESSAELATAGPQALYLVDLPGAVGGLKVGAPVKLRDFVVGEVRSVDFDFDAKTGQIHTPVALALDAERLRPAAAPPSAEEPPAQQLADLRSLVGELLRAGLHARLDQDPPLIGADFVSLEILPNARSKQSGADPGPTPKDPREIPAAPGGGLSDLTGELAQLPIKQIGDNVRTITAQIRDLTTSARTKQSLEKLSQTVSNIDQMVQQVKPQVGPLVATLRQAATQLQGLTASARQMLGGPDEQTGLQQTLDELTRAARSMRSLADYLERHPASLLRGKQP